MQIKTTTKLQAELWLCLWLGRSLALASAHAVKCLWGLLSDMLAGLAFALKDANLRRLAALLSVCQANGFWYTNSKQANDIQKKRGANKNKRQSELDKEDWTIERKTSSTHFPILLYHSISLHLICAYAGEQRHATPVPSSSCILHDTSASDWLWLLVSSKQWQAAAWLAATVQRNGMELKWGRRQAEKRI